MGLRDVKKVETTSSQRMSKTFSLGLIISAIINVVALVFCLVRNQETIEKNWVITYQNAMILFLSIYIFISLIGIVLGLILMLYNEKRWIVKIVSLCGLGSLTLLVGSAFPYGILFNNWEFFGLMLAVCACVIVMDILLLYELKAEVR